MFTSEPPLEDDVRVVADLLWRYSHSLNAKFRLSLRFVLSNTRVLSTTLVEKTNSGRFAANITPPSPEFLKKAQKILKGTPFS